MAVEASELIGNSFRLKKNMQAHKGSPNSGRTTIWESGKKTPIIESWVEVGNEVWWMFGRQDPAMFIKHDPEGLKPVAERGAAEHLSSDLGGEKNGSGSKNNAGMFNLAGLDLSGISTDIGTGLKWAAGIASTVVALLIVGKINQMME